MPADFEPRYKKRKKEDRSSEKKSAKEKRNEKAEKRALAQKEKQEEEEEAAIAMGYQYTARPQTLAHSLCDSPVGLLACMLDAIHTRTRVKSTSPTTSRSRSPFLSPSELELQDATGLDGDIRSQTILEEEEEVEHDGGPLSPRASDLEPKPYAWTATDLLNWTMMHWLPGPEASLRWLRQARIDSARGTGLESEYSAVPLGVSVFRARRSEVVKTPVMWGEATSKISWVRRHARDARFPGWEDPDAVVLDMREWFGGLGLKKGDEVDGEA